MQSSSNSSAPSKLGPRARQLLWYALTVLILAGGIIAWHSDLRRDPPMYFAGIGQSLSTDPARLTYHARNKLLFGEWSLFDSHRWTVFQHSITSLCAYIWFRAAGVSLESAGSVGLTLSLLGLIFLLIGVARHHRPWVLAAIALTFVINVTLLTHGRLSYLENGLILLSAMTLCAYSWFGRKVWGVVVCGVLAAAAMLAGKMFGGLLLPALILSLLFSGREHRWRDAIVVTVSFVVAALGLAIVLYGHNIGTAYAYTGQQAYSLRGFPGGLKSPWGFFEHLIGYGYSNHLFYLNPDLLVFVVIGVLVAVMFRFNKERYSPAGRFAMFWSVCGFVGLMPLNYSPIRYTLFFIPAIIVFCFTTLDAASDARLRREEDRRPWMIVVLAGGLWLGLFHLVGNVFFFNKFPQPIRQITWATLPVAIGLAYVLYWLLRRVKPRRHAWLWWGTLACALLISVISNAFRINRFYFRGANYSIAEANADMAAILSPQAVVSGPYGPALTLATDLRSFIHLFRAAEVFPELYDHNPITHIAADLTEYKQVTKAVPELANLKPETRYFIRDVEVGVFRVADLFHNPRANAYRPTEYERGEAYLQQDKVDSAIAFAASFYARHPDSKSGGILLAEASFRNGQYERAYGLLHTLADRYPTDFNVQLQCGRFLQAMALRKKDANLGNLAQEYYKRALRADPYRGANARRSWQAIEREFGNATSPSAP